MQRAVPHGAVQAAAALALVSTGALGPVLAAAETHTIVLENMRFTPDTVTLRRSDRVVWHNNDLVPHSATAAKVFDSGSIEAGKSWSTPLRKAASVPYVCTFHPSMAATLVVQ